MSRLTVLDEDWKYRDAQQKWYEETKEELRQRHVAARAEKDKAYAVYRGEVSESGYAGVSPETRQAVQSAQDTYAKARDAYRNHCSQGTTFMLHEFERLGGVFPAYGMGYNELSGTVRELNDALVRAAAAPRRRIGGL